MTFTEKKPADKVFGKNVTKVLTVRIPENQFETIKTIVKDYINSYKEDNIKRIKSVKDNIEEIASMYLDIRDYIEKEREITSDKYYRILLNHNEDLINDLIVKYPMKRKIPIKTLYEEKRENEEKLKKEKEIVSSKNHQTTSPVNKTALYKMPKYNDHMLKSNRKK